MLVIVLSGTEYLVCNQAWPHEIFKKWAHKLFQNLKYQKPFLLTSWMTTEEITSDFFFGFNQYSLRLRENFFPCTLSYSLCYFNKGCSLLNLASMRAWNQHTQSHFVLLWENEVAYPKQISSLWQPEGKDHFTLRVWSSHIIWQWLWILLPSRQSRWSLKTAQPLSWTEVMW